MLNKEFCTVRGWLLLQLVGVKVVTTIYSAIMSVETRRPSYQLMFCDSAHTSTAGGRGVSSPRYRTRTTSRTRDSINNEGFMSHKSKLYVPAVAYRGEWFGRFKPPSPRNVEGPPKLCQNQSDLKTVKNC